MAETCCDGGNDVMILACSGGSNVGQLSNQAAVKRVVSQSSLTEGAPSPAGCGCKSCC